MEYLTRGKKSLDMSKRTVAKESPAPTKKRDIKSSEKDDTTEKKFHGSGSIDVMLAQTYDPDRDDPSAWLMSENPDEFHHSLLGAE